MEDVRIRAFTGTILKKDGSDWGAKEYTDHEIVGLYGIQTKVGFFGFMRLGRWGFGHIKHSDAEAARQALKGGEG
ncbi:hypothetical protein OIV19_16595 [Brucella sp. HL-2]|nr:hypothetical protein [Brucella sp. HL-2]MCV9909222.1 hypothetical protein [Brucella sp. HL-2]